MMNSRKHKVMSLEEKVKIIRDFECMPDIRARNNLLKADPVVERIVLNRRTILRQYSIMQTKLAAVKRVAVGFGGSKYKAEKQSLLERVICEWYQRAELLLIKPNKISETVFQDKVKAAMNMLNIASLPPSFSYENFSRRCCFLAKRNVLKESKPTSLRAIIVEFIKGDGISKEYALNIFGVDISADVEGVAITEKKSLQEKLNIIQTYGQMTKSQQVNMKRKNAEVSNIIENKSKILVKYNTMNAKLAVVDSQIQSINVTEKFALLLKIMVEWYLRADENPGAKGATISKVELREKTYTALIIFRFSSLPLYSHWLSDLWKSCQEAKKKAVHGKRSLPLGLKVIAKYVLAREGVSEKLALTYFGVDISGGEEVRASKVPRIDSRTQASYLDNDENEASDDIETRMGDDFEPATFSTISIQRTNLNECLAAEEDDDDTFELYDVASTKSSDDCDAKTSTEFITYNDLIKEEFDIGPQNEVKQEDNPASSTKASFAIKVEDDESQPPQDFSTDTFIRPSVQDWLLQNGYEIAADVQEDASNLQEDASNLVKEEVISISSLTPVEDILNNQEDEYIEKLTFISEGIVKNEMTGDPYTVINVKSNEDQAVRDRLENTSGSSISDSVQEWLIKNEHGTTGEESNLGSSLTLPLMPTDRINVKVEDSLNNEDHVSNLDNDDDESIDMLIFVDADVTRVSNQKSQLEVKTE